MKILKKIFIFSQYFIMIFLLSCIICFIVTFFYHNKNIYKANIYGFRGYIVPSGSMEPTIKSGQYVIVKKCSYDSIKENDIIVYITNDKEINYVVIHRVIKITPEGLITKGDNNKYSDKSPVTHKQIVGKVIF